jgi:hypothetical protein
MDLPFMVYGLFSQAEQAEQSADIKLAKIIFLKRWLLYRKEKEYETDY